MEGRKSCDGHEHDHDLNHTPIAGGEADVDLNAHEMERDFHTRQVGAGDVDAGSK